MKHCAAHDRVGVRQQVRQLRRAADQARLIGDHALMNALLGGALRLIDPGDTATLAEVRPAVGVGPAVG